MPLQVQLGAAGAFSGRSAARAGAPPAALKATTPNTSRKSLGLATRIPPNIPAQGLTGGAIASYCAMVTCGENLRVSACKARNAQCIAVRGRAAFSHKGRGGSGVLRASIHHDLDAVAHLDLGL